MSDVSLYDRLGGEAAIQAAVVRFYEKMLADPELAGFFEHMDMQRQIDKMIAFMSLAFGGPSDYDGPGLQEAHAGLVKRGLGGAHFDKTAGHLDATLIELEVSPELRAEVLGIVGGTRDDVLAG